MTHETRGSNWLPVGDALTGMLQALACRSRDIITERVDLIDAVNRVVANDVISKLNVPPTDNSSMDGYALVAATSSTDCPLQLIGKAMAGNPYPGTVGTGQCVRIMTGAPIPDGADAVALQEDTEVIGDQVHLKGVPAAGENVRPVGENIDAGDTVVAAGTRLNAAKIALLASLGEAKVDVVAPITVGVIATGDELAQPGEPLKFGQIYEANRVMIASMLTQFGAKVLDYGIVPDDPQATRTCMLKANEECDLVITSGGVSVGDADYVREVLDEIGEVGFWKVAIKPGKPFAFGRLPQAWFCGLPGNPVSSYVTCQQLVLPFIAALQGEAVEQALILRGTAECDIKKAPGRMDFQRGICRTNESGELVAKPNGPQGSGIMSSVANANCYILFEREQGGVKQGDPIQIIPFNPLIS